MDFVLPTPPSFLDLASTIRLVGDESAISRGENIKRQEYVDHLGTWATVLGAAEDFSMWE